MTGNYLKLHLFGFLHLMSTVICHLSFLEFFEKYMLHIHTQNICYVIHLTHYSDICVFCYFFDIKHNLIV